jgi:hypothetical protein
MTRVLKGEPLGPAELFVPLAVSALLTLMALAWMSRRLSDAAVR